MKGTLFQNHRNIASIDYNIASRILPIEIKIFIRHWNLHVFQTNTVMVLTKEIPPIDREPCFLPVASINYCLHRSHSSSSQRSNNQAMKRKLGAI
jgi:hypothetical protein